MIFDRMHITITLALSCTFVSVILGIFSGSISAVRKNSTLDYGIMVAAILLIGFTMTKIQEKNVLKECRMQRDGLIKEREPLERN
jgi:ABC-type microcin C transport system permease subunit YejB